MHSEGKTMENKLVSVIVPVYNVETYLKRCITSLLAQSYANTEIILVDDGSTDASGKICDHYAASHPSLICLHQTNQGQSCARNAGMRIAHGDYYMFVDSDDYIEPDMIAAMVAESESRDADIVVCGYWMEYPFLSVRRRMCRNNAGTQSGDWNCCRRTKGSKILPGENCTARLCSKALYFRSAVSKIFIRSTGYSQEHSVSRCFRSECIIMCSGKKASQIQKAFLPRMHSCCGRCTKLLHTSRKRSRSFIRKEYTYRTEIILSLRS